ncbi:hypothetical protein [Kitasatospora viridis]|uniref:Tail sheath protein n=1 Tax=Kitasatospora viridis TaxID=281105 RepID=A0A561S9V2_9ACTN|nr:hypothetical protein [Kitasatospora viridis]TWF71650.1 tail sheath protein [Kitasatospora viridis]
MVDVSGTTYTPPGVSVSDVTAPSVAPRSVTTNAVTLVGPALGYQTASEVLAVYSASNVALAQTGAYTQAVVGPPAIPAPVVRKLDGTLLTVGVDYSLTTLAGTDGASTAVTVLKRLSADSGDLTKPSPNGLKDGDLVRIAYQFTSPSYYTPQQFESFADVVATYGAPMLTTAPLDPSASQVTSPLTLAAKVALENGAASVICLPTNPAEGIDFREQLRAAYAKLEANYLIQLIVPLWVDGAYNTHSSTNVANLLTDIKNHCENAAAAGYGRLAFVGLPRNYDNASTHDQLAIQTASKRVVLAYPNRLLLFNAAVNASTEVDGYYLAAAMAGQLARNAVNRGLTRSVLSSFSGLPASVAQAMTMAAKNTLSKSGVAVAEINRTSQLMVRHGVTTNMSALLTSEISMVRIGDTLLQMVQTGLDSSGLIGAPIDADMTMNVKGALAGILERAVADGTIIAYANLQVRQLSPDPSVIAATFQYKPAAPLNYITVSLSVDLTTGDTSAQQQQ